MAQAGAARSALGAQPVKKPLTPPSLNTLPAVALRPAVSFFAGETGSEGTLRAGREAARWKGRSHGKDRAIREESVGTASNSTKRIER